MSIALDGYGLDPQTVSNVSINGYGVGVDLGALPPIPPNTGIIGDLPLDGIISIEPADIISMELPVSLVGSEIVSVKTQARATNIIGIVGGSIVGSESKGIVGSEPDSVVSLLPRDILDPRSTTPVESEEPNDDIISEEP